MEDISQANYAHYNNYKDLGVEKYQILSTLDTETCSFCANMDLKVFDMKDYEEGVTAPPFHPWCRCTTIPYFDDEFQFGERAARDTNGKTYYVPKNMSYKEWKEKFVLSNPTEKHKFEIINLKKKNFELDYKEYIDYQESNIFKKSNLGKTIYEFQDIKYNNTDEYKKIKEYYNLYQSNILPNVTYTKWKKLKKG